ncbi:MAG: hypothetical protein ABIJ37_03200 [Pseudomonadota bacterium]
MKRREYLIPPDIEEGNGKDMLKQFFLAFVLLVIGIGIGYFWAYKVFG